MERIIGIIQARFSATRLPGKVLLKLADKTVLEHVIRRVKRSRLINETIVATSINKADLGIVKLCSSIGVRAFCGCEDDCLDRFYQAARLFGADHIVRITADCPIIDPSIIDKVIRTHLAKRADYTANVIDPTFPDGEDVEVFTFSALKIAWQKARLISEREHVTPFMRNHPRSFKCVNVKNDKDVSGKRWTLDKPEDYKLLSAIYGNLYKKDRFFGMKEVLSFLKAHPEHECINGKIVRNEGYIKSLKNDKRIKSYG